jgi:tRNA-Thr(GGU) m(6)t(6)A37 methyltransferase TsaA
MAPDAPIATIEAKVIGHVRSAIADEAVPRRRRDMVVDIEVLPEYRAALTGIEAYSHLFVLFWMHKAARADTPMLAHPHGNKDLPEVGVLAARGRNHPNPIGLAVVELIGHDGLRLTVRKLDAFDGTPVIDIKPYDGYDQVEHLRLPAWWKRKK